MNPVFMANLIVISFNLFYFQAFVPRISQHLLRTFEEIFDMTLSTNKSAHLLASRHGVWIVIFNPFFLFYFLDGIDKSGPRDTEVHCLRIMAIDACNWVADMFPTFL